MEKHTSKRSDLLRRSSKRQDSFDIQIAQGTLKRIAPNEEFSRKELDESKLDLEKAEFNYKNKNWKWTIIISYYAMFHSAKALLYSHGLSERTHKAVLIALEHFQQSGIIQEEQVLDYAWTMDARKEADYAYTYDEGRAKEALEVAKGFSEAMEKTVIQRRNEQE